VIISRRENCCFLAY